MHSFNILLFALMGMLLGAQAGLASKDVETMKGNNGVTYTIIPTEMDVKINETYTLHGTVDEVRKRVAEMGDSPAGAPTKPSATIDSDTPTSITSGLVSRDVGSAVGNFCEVGGWSDGKCGDFKACIQTFIELANRDVPVPSVLPGPGTCVKTCCEGSSAVYWCNDNDFEFALDSWNNITDGVNHIMNACTFTNNGNCDGGTFNGQQFYSKGWNVIARDAKCHN